LNDLEKKEENNLKEFQLKKVDGRGRCESA